MWRDAVGAQSTGGSRTRRGRAGVGAIRLGNTEALELYGYIILIV